MSTSGNTPIISSINTNNTSSISNKLVLNVSNTNLSNNLNGQMSTASGLTKSLFQQANTKLNSNVATPIINSNTLMATPNQTNSNLQSTLNLLPSNQIAPNSTSAIASPNNNASSSSYGGFAHCSNCGDYGVKAAFYGKSKLYCSVACQNGIKKQQQQVTQGTKRTIESLNYSSCGSSNNSPVLPSSANIITQTTNLQAHATTPVISTNLTNNSIISQIQNNDLTINTSQTALNNKNSESIRAEPVQSVQASPINIKAQVPVQKLNNTKSQDSLPSNTSYSTNQDGNAPKRLRTNSSTSSISQSQSDFNPKSDSLSTDLTANDSALDSSSAKTSKFKIQKTNYQWSLYIEEKKCKVAPVHFFKHVPLNEFWKKLETNIIIEVPNLDTPISDNQKYYWFASVIEYAGYLAKLRYIGYEEESKNDFWMHACDSNLHPIGWSSDNDISLAPPDTIIDQREDWRKYLIEKMPGFKTIPKNFHKKVNESLESKFKKGMLLELVDKKRLCNMRIGRVIDNVGGRIRMKYENNDDFDDFWCHESSELIHPIGWSAAVGHQINASEEYKKKSAVKFKKNVYESNECSEDMFRKVNLNTKQKPFKVGMKFEAIDPLNLSTICVATVAKVLNDGYLMVRIDGYQIPDDSDLFCYHRTSSSLFPAGYCHKNSLRLHEPFGFKGRFSWKNYLNSTNSEFAPTDLFNADTSMHNPFKCGMKLESVDLMEPKMVCVATVVAVVDRLLRLNFDGWEREYDQWVDYESCDIYPVGWCELVNYPLQAPLSTDMDSKSKVSKKSSRKQK